jgi:putative two-component system response regulator
MKILAVDDSRVSLTLIEQTLKRAGYEVGTATDGKTALEMVRTGEYRMVISDWEMPHLSGLDLCRAIRRENIPGYVYFVLLTHHNLPRELVEGFDAGADDFMVKPFHAPELLARVRAGERMLSLETREVAIFAMARLAESRDPETGAHLERVRGYCQVLAADLAQVPKFRGEVNDEFVRLIYLTSPLHDIGKVGIPDSVLLKPGRLSDREFEIMKMHTTVGAQTLDDACKAFPNVKYLQMARDIAASHHERWDGTGYPDGLTGTDIPLCGRIVALADVYDALTSKRVYKSAFSHEVAKATILKESGTHFDPDVVEAFQRREEDFLAIRAKYDEPMERAA